MSHPEYLVRHGLLGDIGRFRATSAVQLRRGQRVVIRGPRGTEIGEVVRPADVGGPGHGGELVRAASRDDDDRQAALARRAGQLAEQAGALAGSLQLPVAVFDAEVLLDGQHAALTYVCPPGTDWTPLRRQLEQQSGLFIAWHDLTRPDATVDAGCGDCASGGCGSGGCGSGGCGSGGCGDGACGSASAEELQAYFAEVRQIQERRVSLL